MGLEEKVEALGRMVGDSVNVLVTAMGMAAENQSRIQRGESLAYTEETFRELVYKCGLDPNSVISRMRG